MERTKTSFEEADRIAIFNEGQYVFDDKEFTEEIVQIKSDGEFLFNNCKFNNLKILYARKVRF